MRLISDGNRISLLAIPGFMEPPAWMQGAAEKLGASLDRTPAYVDLQWGNPIRCPTWFNLGSSLASLEDFDLAAGCIVLTRSAGFPIAVEATRAARVKNVTFVVTAVPWLFLPSRRSHLHEMYSTQIWRCSLGPDGDALGVSRKLCDSGFDTPSEPHLLRRLYRAARDSWIDPSRLVNIRVLVLQQRVWFGSDEHYCGNEPDPGRFDTPDPGRFDTWLHTEEAESELLSLTAQGLCKAVPTWNQLIQELRP